MCSDTTILICKPGFTDRLSKVLDDLGVPERGRIQLIAKWTGLSPTASRNMLAQDRLPRAPQHFKLIAMRLCDLLKEGGKEVSSADMERYLLGRESLNTTKASLDKSSKQLESSTLDVIEKGQLHVTLHECGQELGVNVFSDLSHASFGDLYEKAAKIKTTLKCDVDSKDMREIIKALIKTSM